MSYFERFKLKNADDEVINPAEDESLTLLRRIFQALKPLGQITGGGSNRLSVDVNSGAVTVSSGTITTVTTVTTTTTVGTVTSMTNLAGVGGVAAFDLMKAQSRTAYNTGNRGNISFS